MEFKVFATSFTHDGVQLGSQTSPFVMDDGEVFAWYTNVTVYHGGGVKTANYRWVRLHLVTGALHCWSSVINVDNSMNCGADAVY